MGHQFVIVRPGTKVPAFRGWQHTDYTEVELRRWLDEQDYNVGIMTGGGLVVVDIDSSDPAKVNWVIDHCGDTPMKCRTPRGGVHLYYRTRPGVRFCNRVKIRGEPYDMRWNGCFVVCPRSCNSDGVAYEWAGPILPARELPPLNASPLRERQLPPRRHAAMAIEFRTRLLASDIRDLTAYIRQIPSLQGQNGSAGLMRVCLLLVEHGRSFEAAGQELRAWNQACAVPPWSERELDHALTNAFRKKRASAVGGGRPSRPLL